MGIAPNALEQVLQLVGGPGGNLGKRVPIDLTDTGRGSDLPGIVGQQQPLVELPAIHRQSEGIALPSFDARNALASSVVAGQSVPRLSPTGRYDEGLAQATDQGDGRPAHVFAPNPILANVRGGGGGGRNAGGGGGRQDAFDWPEFFHLKAMREASLPFSQIAMQNLYGDYRRAAPNLVNTVNASIQDQLNQNRLARQSINEQNTARLAYLIPAWQRQQEMALKMQLVKGLLGSGMFGSGGQAVA